MNCTRCSALLVPNAAFCHACGTAVPGAPSPTKTGGGDFDRLLDEASRSAHELAAMAVRLSDKVVKKADSAAQDPGAAARRVLRRTGEELRKAGDEIEKALKKLD